MSSLTIISSGMDDSLEVEDLVDTRLCLSLSLATGAVSRPPPPAQALLPASPPPGAAAGTKRKGPQSGTVGSTTTTRRHGKKARTLQGDSNADDEGGEAAGGSARKKLRLTGEQATLLEKSFRAHNVLSHGEKNDLAWQLGLKARQVEVWFQNRRARTKLKQTELDCNQLRRWCERLSHDNERLRLELSEARYSSSSAFLSSLTPPRPVTQRARPARNSLAGRCG